MTHILWLSLASTLGIVSTLLSIASKKCGVGVFVRVLAALLAGGSQLEEETAACRRGAAEKSYLLKGIFIFSSDITMRQERQLSIGNSAASHMI